MNFFRAAVAACLILTVLRIAAPEAGAAVLGAPTMPWYSYALHSNWDRQGIERRLSAMGGKHLVLVQYRGDHRPDFEWVYNRADIDAAPVVWARMVPDTTKLAELLKYYSGRRIWIIYPDDDPKRLVQYREAKQ